MCLDTFKVDTFLLYGDSRCPAHVEKNRLSLLSNRLFRPKCPESCMGNYTFLLQDKQKESFWLSDG